LEDVAAFHRGSGIRGAIASTPGEEEQRRADEKRSGNQETLFRYFHPTRSTKEHHLSHGSFAATKQERTKLELRRQSRPKLELGNEGEKLQATAPVAESDQRQAMRLAYNGNEDKYWTRRFRIISSRENVGVSAMAKTAAKKNTKSKTAPKARTKSKAKPRAKKRSSKKGVVAKVAGSIVSAVASVLPSGSKKKK
jgi:hypothetical protein